MLEVIIGVVLVGFALVLAAGVLRLLLAAGHAIFKTRKWREWNEQQEDR